MSRRSRRQKNTPKSWPETSQHKEIHRLVAAEVSRRLSQMTLPPGAKPRALNQDALFAQMQAQQSPEKQGTPMFSPGAPLIPSPGLVNPGGPRTYQFPVGYNIQSQPRSDAATSFDTLRNLAALYDGIQLCEQVWLDTVAKLSLKIKPRAEIIAEQGQSVASSKYTDRIRKYTDFFAYPDVGNGYDLKAWLRAAIRDQLQLDAVAIYVRRNRGGGVYSLELVDGSSVKPLIDSRGRRPQPPFPAFQQFLYGVPAGLYTSDEMLYQRETVRTESIYGLSRVERIILRINQALRKENKDLARFTDGNVPPGIMSPPDDGSQWTPEQLMVYQEMWDALLAGNDQARSRIKVIQPGSTLTPLQEPDIFVDFDRFLLNVTAACYSMTMADLGFTESVNKSSGESQENVFYRRAVQPLMDRYATLFTYILRYYFGEQDLVVAWSGFEESEDFNAMAASYVALTNAGITSPTTAAHQMNLPWSGPEIPNFVMTKDGPMFLEDAASGAIRRAAMEAKLAGYGMASQPSSEPLNNGANSDGDEATESDEEQQQTGVAVENNKAGGRKSTPSGYGAKSPVKRVESNERDSATPTRSVEKGDVAEPEPPSSDNEDSPLRSTAAPSDTNDEDFVALSESEMIRDVNEKEQSENEATLNGVSVSSPIRELFGDHISDADYAQIQDALQQCQVSNAINVLPNVKRSDREDLRPEVVTEHTGIMVAFMVRPEIAEQLALPDGEPAQDLHVTLCYMGEAFEMPQDGYVSPVETLDTLRLALASFAKRQEPLSGTTGGIGRFINEGDDANPVISLVNVPGLQELRRQLVEALNAAGYFVHNDWDYSPHITLKYIASNDPMPINDMPTLPLVFDELCLAVGDDRYYFPVGNEPPPIAVESDEDEVRSARLDIQCDNPRAWRPPSETQLSLETKLAKAVKSFIDQAKVSRDGVRVPDEATQTKLLEEITDLLSEAVHEGRRVATGLEERALISAVKNLAGRAVQLVGDVIQQITDKAQEIIEHVFGGGEDIDQAEALKEVQSHLDDWAADYSEMVGQTEITAALEEAVLDQGVKRGHTQKYWNADPEACQICRENASVSPIPIGTAFPDGSKQPPLHPRCRCSTTTE